jgi:CheY-like chemotaxis protein
MTETRESNGPGDRLPTQLRGRLLLVDDEPGVLRVLRLILGRHHELCTEENAEAALQRILAGQQFDVIFSDLMMPGMTGIALLKELTDVAPAQAKRLVFLTGGASTREAREFLATTSNRLIEKPFDADEILGFVSDRIAEGALIP